MVALLLPAIQQARESARSTSKQQEEKSTADAGVLIFEFEDGARDVPAYTAPAQSAPEPVKDVLLTELLFDAEGPADSWAADDFGI